MLNSLCQINKLLSKCSRLEYILVPVTASNILAFAGASVIKIIFLKKIWEILYCLEMTRSIYFR